MNKAVFAITKDLAHTQTTIDNLLTGGFDDDEISVLGSDSSGNNSFGSVKETKAPEGATTGATTGGVVGGVIGLLAGLGALAIPGVGPLIAAGPIMGALSGLGIGAATGGLVGGLIGLGIPEYVAKNYNDRLESGNFLISVHTYIDEEVKSAKDIFEASGATDISDANVAESDKKKEVIAD